MPRKEDIFIALNTVDNIPEKNYYTISSLIHLVKAFACVNYQSIYLIDYYKQEFLYVSDNPLFLCGHTPQEVQEMGYQFYLQHIPAEEQKLLIEFNSNGLKLLEKFNKIDLCNGCISCDFHLLQNSKKTLINRKLAPILLTDEGKIWIALCVISISAHKSPGHVEFHLNRSYDYWIYSFEEHNWKTHRGIVIKEAEKEVLNLAAKGFTMYEISKIMCRSVDTIKFYKRNLFKKLQVANITEAVSRATIYKLL